MDWHLVKPKEVTDEPVLHFYHILSSEVIVIEVISCIVTFGKHIEFE
jgi:hypothetical protein